MKQTKKKQNSKEPRTMLDQEVGSMEDKKTNEDFNNVHPDHDENGLTQSNSKDDLNNSTKKLKLKNNEK